MYLQLMSNICKGVNSAVICQSFIPIVSLALTADRNLIPSDSKKTNELHLFCMKPEKTKTEPLLSLFCFLIYVLSETFLELHFWKV